MYIRYIKKLYDLHLSAQNYVEAGLTLKLYAQLLQWREVVRKEELDYPSQPEWERKERVYLQILDCFDKGKVSMAHNHSCITHTCTNAHHMGVFFLFFSFFFFTEGVFKIITYLSC